MKNKLLFLTLILSIFFLTQTFPVAAVKRLPQARKSTKSAGVSGGFYISARLRRDRKALNVTFGGLSSVSAISYMLSYKTNGRDEGAYGSLNPAGQRSASRELHFGTCSSGVCNYHTNIIDARFEVTTTFKNGKQAIKRYRIRP